MRPSQRVAFFPAAVAAAALSLAGCAADTSVETAPPAFRPDSLVTVTFPDGKLSFQHPKEWHVEFFHASESPYVGTATVSDPTSQAKISIYTGQIADVVASSAARTVLETDPVPGLVGQSVPTPHASFFVDRSGDAAQYRMGLTPGLPVSPDGEAQDGLIMLGDRVLTADVVFTGQPFANDEEAKAWYWGAEGQALKALLMSFSYPAVVPAATSSPVPAGPVTFTFADGRLSFAHPEGWRVEHEEVSASPTVETATVYDAGGNEQINIYYSQVGDATAGPATRFVLETDPVPGLIGHSVPTPSSSFFVDRANGATHYRMGLTPGSPISPDGKVQYGLVKIGDRILTADVLFTGEPFADDVAAKAWYWGDEGRALKSVLMSFSYR